MSNKFVINVLYILGKLNKCMTYYFFRKILKNDGRIYAWKKMGAKIEGNVKISAGLNMRFPNKVSIGSGTAITGKKIWIDSWGEVTIGRNVLMNDDIQLFSAGHPVDSPEFGDGTEFIEIGDYVWLPHSIIILPGVKIGHYAVIGTGSVVSRDVPDYGVAVGNPARVVKERKKINYTYVPSNF